jgi:hypothetical protein
LIGAPAPFGYVLIPQAKIIHYLLNPAHPDGGSKARFFLGHGFSRDEPEAMAEALFRHVASQPVVTVRPGRWGAQIAVSGPMTMPDRSVHSVLSAWLHQESGDGAFVTAYPER